MKRIKLFSPILVAAALALAAICGAEPNNQHKPTVIVVVGAAGTPEYQAEFAQGAAHWEKAALEGEANFVAIGLGEMKASSDLQCLQELLANQSQPSDAPLWLILIGHGTYDGRAAKFNLRGADLSAKQLAQWLEPFSGPVAVINTAAASAPFINRLSAPGRVVITATKSGSEQNYTRFGGYLADVIADPNADLDKDGQTSLLEAHLTGAHRAQEFYDSAGRLATEHALLDDNGDGLGTRADWFRGIRPIKKARDDAALDGYRAHQFYLVPGPEEKSFSPERRARRDQLELEIFKLRDNNKDLRQEQYFARLEPLLLELAGIYEQ